MEDNEIKLLTRLFQDAEIGMISIDKVVKKIEDSTIEKMFIKQYEAYDKFKEKCDVRILFGFGNVQLSFPEGGKILRKGVFDHVRRESHALVFITCVVNGKAGIHRSQIAALSYKIHGLAFFGIRVRRELFLRKGAGYLAGTVGPEVEKYYGISFLYKRHGLTVFHNVGG